MAFSAESALSLGFTTPGSRRRRGICLQQCRAGMIVKGSRIVRDLVSEHLCAAGSGYRIHRTPTDTKNVVMNTRIDWEYFHDATLNRINVQWSERTCELTFAASSGSVSVFATGLRKLVLQNESPWGHSVSVNSARLLAQIEGQPSKLEIEMQSGDIISVEASRIFAEVLSERQ